MQFCIESMNSKLWVPHFWYPTCVYKKERKIGVAPKCTYKIEEYLTNIMNYDSNTKQKQWYWLKLQWLTFFFKRDPVQRHDKEEIKWRQSYAFCALFEFDKSLVVCAGQK